MASADRLSQTLKQRIGGGGGATIEDAYNLLVGLLNGDEPATLSGGSSLNRFAAPVRLTTFDGVTNAGATLTDSLTGRDAPSLLVRGQHGVHQEIEKSSGGKVFGAYDSGIELGDTLVAGTFDVTGVSTFKNDVFVQNGVGTVLAHFVTTAGAQRVILGEQSTTPGLLIDVANLRTQVGAVTLPSGLAGDKFDVIGGRTYLVANNEDVSLGLRYGSGAVGSYFLGTSNAAAPDLVLRNNAGTRRASLLDGGTLIVGAATAPVGSELLLVKGGIQAEGLVTITSGGEDVTGNILLRSGKLVVDGTTFSGAEKFRVVSGSSRLEGQLVVTTGGINVTGGANIANGITTSGDFVQSSGNFSLPNASLGFFGSAPNTKQTVTGSRGGNAALQSLLSALANYGLVVDSSSA